jgi:hypothetical protein
VGASRLLPVAVVIAGHAAGLAHAEDLLPTHTGESGDLDIPVAESLGKPGAAFSLDLRATQSSDTGRGIGPSPFTMSFGMGRAEAGFSLRQGGMPGDPRPSNTIPAGVGKFSILEAQGKRPALAVDLMLDRINRTPAAHLRAIVTSDRVWRMRATAVGGFVMDTDRSSGWTAGAAVSLLGPRRTDLVVEVLRVPSGLLTGAGLRWHLFPQFAFGLEAGYLPDANDAKTWLAGLSIYFVNPPPAKPAKSSEGEKEQEEASKPRNGKRTFASERPRFALEIRQRPAPGAEGGPAPHYPSGDSATEPAAPLPSRTEAHAEPASIEPPPTAPASDAQRPDAGAVSTEVAPAAEPDAGPAQERSSADAGQFGTSDVSPDAGAGASEVKTDAAPARIERPVPLPPALKEGASAKDQLRDAIAGFQPALKQCVDRALKRDPGLRGEARIELDIRPDGRVKLAAVRSRTLAGGWFEECVRRATDAWRMPRTPKGYTIEIPLKIHIAEGGSR